VLKDIDVEAEASAFYTHANDDLCRTASLPSDSRIHIPRKPKKNSQIATSHL
jgi:hypothetical protein